jgi:hypothetical protein
LGFAVISAVLISVCFFWVCRRIPISCRSISTAPVRGGSHFLCGCKESNQRKQLVTPAVIRTLANFLVQGGPRLSVALKGITGLGSRTVCQARSFSALVQHEIASAQRYALPWGMQGKPSRRLALQEARASPIDPSAAKRAGAISC